jgi:hypothetical protein
VPLAMVSTGVLEHCGHGIPVRWVSEHIFRIYKEKLRRNFLRNSHEKFIRKRLE